MKFRHPLAPIRIDRAHHRIIDHDRADLLGDGTHLGDIGTADAERHREGRRGTEEELRGPHPRRRRKTVGHRPPQALLQRIPFLFGRRADDDLCKGRIGQLRR